MHARSQFGFYLFEFGRHPLAYRLSEHSKLATPLFPANVREAEEVEGFWFSCATLLSAPSRETAEFQKLRFIRIKLQIETCQTFFQLSPETLSVLAVLETHEDVVSISHDDYISSGFLLPPLIRKKIEYIVEVDIRKYRAHA